MNDTTTTKFDKVKDKVQEKLENTEREHGTTVHELENDITSRPSNEYLAQHGTTGATIKRRKTRVQAMPDGRLMLQRVKDVQCSPATGPYTEVLEEEEISMADAVARIVHDLEAMDYEDWRESRYNPNKMEA